MSFYVDSCIWINLFKKEENKSNGKRYWKIAKEFLKIAKHNKIIISTITLKELSFRLNYKYNIALKFFKHSSNIQIVKTKNSDYNFARKLEFETNCRLSFYDYIHIAITKRLNCILITRDNELITLAKGIIPVNKPEDLISHLIYFI
ncbi:PIN domain-containing protein [Candidatus Woesearchaeota archaeon]|nr:PIN domain-containing protein [Candidatus Woesearchaeota archaeon]